MASQNVVTQRVGIGKVSARRGGKKSALIAQEAA